MNIEIREPREGELWWRKDSEEWFSAKRDGLYYYTSKIRNEPFMWRCYSSASDMDSQFVPYHFGQIDFGRPFTWETYQLVSGEWFLAAEANQVAAFLRKQVEQYRQSAIGKVEKEVAEMTAVIDIGNHPHCTSLKWIV